MDNYYSPTIVIGMYLNRDGSSRPPHSLDTYFEKVRPDVSSEADAVTTWSYAVDHYGRVMRYITEHYANEQDAVNRFRELFLQNFNYIKDISFDMRRFVDILSNNRIVERKEPVFYEDEEPVLYGPQEPPPDAP